MTGLPQLFDRVPPSALTERRYEKDQSVFQQNAPCGGLWLVRRGRVDVHRVTDAGHLVLIHRALEGEIFGEASLFAERYHCAAVVAQRSVLVEVNRQWLLDALKAQPTFASLLCEVLAGQVQFARRLVEILSVRNAEERVFLAAAHGMMDDDLKAFSARIGLTHEAVYRALASLTRKGRMSKTSRGRYAVAVREKAQVK